MLEELALYHKKWLGMALKISNNKDDAEDLVQEMYLKLYAKESINDGYIFKTLKNLWLNTITRNKEVVTDLEKYNATSDDYDLESDNDFQIKIDKINNAFNNVSQATKLIVIHSINDGQSKFCRESKISIRTVVKHKELFKRKVYGKES